MTVHVLELIALLGGVLGTVALLFRAVRRGARMINQADRAWALLERELSPNGGGSTYDRVRAIAHEQRNQRLLLELHLRDPRAHDPLKEVI